MGGMPGWGSSGPQKEEDGAEDGAAKSDDLAQIKKQLAELQKKLSRM
jgi:hypothetical protein